MSLYEYLKQHKLSFDISHDRDYCSVSVYKSNTIIHYTSTSEEEVKNKIEKVIGKPIVLPELPRL